MDEKEKEQLDHELQLWLDRRRKRRGHCTVCGKPYAKHRAKVTDPANGCALAELLGTISDTMVKQQRNNI
jgi:hypothetical protein